MPVLSPERAEVEKLTVFVQDHEGFDHAKFDPTLVTQLGSPDNPEGSTAIFLKRTNYLPTDVGYKAVALFSERGPGITREASGDIIHRSVNRGFLLRRPTESEIEASRMPDIDPKMAWIFEALVPKLDSPDTLMPTSVVSDPYIPRTF